MSDATATSTAATTPSELPAVGGGGAASTPAEGAEDDGFVRLDVMAWILNMSEEELGKIYDELEKLYDALPPKRAELIDMYTGLYGLSDKEASDKIEQLENVGAVEDPNAQEREYADMCAPLRAARVRILACLQAAQNPSGTGSAAPAPAPAPVAAVGGAGSS